MQERGYLEGSEMATTFNMLRANDLIWSFVVNNYLLGRDPFPFDLLYWNSDSTRMPAAMHSFYLRNMYLKNLLAQPGGIVLNEHADRSRARVRTPLYFISTVEDHIAPWKSCYAGARLFEGPVRFVLGGSGHIAGIINPPSANKYSLLDERCAARGARGLARRRPSSIRARGGSTGRAGSSSTAARKCRRACPGSGALPVIEDAPGSYVAVRAEKK